MFVGKRATYVHADHSTNTCANPSIAKTFFRVFNGLATVQVLNLYCKLAFSNILKAAPF